MIKKLRHKFILINMAFVTSILAVVLGIFYSANVMRVKDMTEMSMSQALGRERFKKEAGRDEPRRRGEGGPLAMVPVFVVHLGEDNAVSEIHADNIEVSGDLATRLTAIVMKKGEPDGILKGYSLRYRKDVSPEGTYIVFADQSFEISSLRSLLRNCIFVFLLAVFLFLLLSLFLSRWALKPVEQAWMQQKQFIADASHELKTPLTVILANLQILSSHPSATIREEKKWLANTEEEARRMKRLVEELLFLARSDANALPSSSQELADLDFSDLILNCSLLFESVAFEQKQELNSQIAPGLHVLGNQEQLKQMAGILLDNACKYAGSYGSVWVALGKAQHMVILSVTNTGEPIPPEARKHVFQRFYRADESRVRMEGGYGLGLAIAQTIVNRHKGKISVSTDKENRTVFTVALPQKE